MNRALLVVAALALVLVGSLVLVTATGALGFSNPLLGSDVDENGDPLYSVVCEGRVALTLSSVESFGAYECSRVSECRSGGLLSWWAPDWLEREGEVRLIIDGMIEDKDSITFNRLTDSNIRATEPFVVSTCTGADDGQLKYVGETGRIITEEVSFI